MKNRAVRDEQTRRKANRRLRRAHLKWASGDRCSTCAYRPGTVASTDADDVGLTRLRRALLDAAEPFYCHEEGPMPGRRKLCNGHMEALTARHRNGHYERHDPSAPHVLNELRTAYEWREAAFKAATQGDQ